MVRGRHECARRRVGWTPGQYNRARDVVAARILFRVSRAMDPRPGAGARWCVLRLLLPHGDRRTARRRAPRRFAIPARRGLIGPVVARRVQGIPCRGAGSRLPLRPAAAVEA